MHAVADIRDNFWNPSSRCILTAKIHRLAHQENDRKQGRDHE